MCLKDQDTGEEQLQLNSTLYFILIIVHGCECIIKQNAHIEISTLDILIFQVQEYLNTTN